ncbi:MAG: DNA replication/repair protein RecF, partial [Chloroflexi bacterium]|nr:DNA replication/repair protein RecF [Chloroflexota bacterium]
MKIHNLSLTNFRAFKRIEIDFSDHLNLFIGQNAQGKTTILEAIHFLSLLTSPSTGSDREVINFLTLSEDIPVARIKAGIERAGNNHHLELRLILNGNQGGNQKLRKEFFIDGVQRRLVDSVGFFNSILFLPQMTRIIEDGPDERRRYLDQTLSQAIPSYVRALSSYIKGVSRRNALLKQLAESGSDQDQLLFWDELLADNGSEIVHHRIQAVNELNQLASDHHRELTNGKEILDIIYQPSISSINTNNVQEEGGSQPPQDNEIKKKFLNQLKAKRREEIARGVTTIGPHRDDIQFMVNGVDMGVYGSRGQIRTVIMALKFAEKDWFKSKSGELPVILLDETLAELDGSRRLDL